MTAAQRQAATQQHALAIAAINEMFDKVEELAVARDRLTGVAPLGPDDDAIRDAATLLAHAALLNEALTQLRAVALTAAEHRNRHDLAADIGTKSATLFPRQVRPPVEPAQLSRVPRRDPMVADAEEHEEAS